MADCRDAPVPLRATLVEQRPGPNSIYESPRFCRAR
jgi:hypothetical protein